MLQKLQETTIGRSLVETGSYTQRYEYKRLFNDDEKTAFTDDGQVLLGDLIESNKSGEPLDIAIYQALPNVLYVNIPVEILSLIESWNNQAPIEMHSGLMQTKCATGLSDSLKKLQVIEGNGIFYVGREYDYKGKEVDMKLEKTVEDTYVVSVDLVRRQLKKTLKVMRSEFFGRNFSYLIGQKSSYKIISNQPVTGQTGALSIANELEGMLSLCQAGEVSLVE